METIKQLRERWFRRRAVTTPPESVEPPRSLYTNIDTGEIHSGVASGLDSHAVEESGILATDESRTLSVQKTAAPFTDPVSTTNNVCKRCRRLRIRPSTGHFYHFLNEPFTVITAESLYADCDSCSRFRDVFEHCKIPGSFTLRQTIWYFDDLGYAEYIENWSIGAWCLAENITFYPTRPILGGSLSCVVRRIHLDGPDYQSIRTQLETCMTNHSRCCLRPQPFHRPLKVIDCNSRRIVKINCGIPYMCLSYVWGSNSVQETDILRDELPPDVPKTVEDAMFVAINLGIPFLWVDRY